MVRPRGHVRHVSRGRRGHCLLLWILLHGHAGLAVKSAEPLGLVGAHAHGRHADPALDGLLRRRGRQVHLGRRTARRLWPSLHGHGRRALVVSLHGIHVVL